MARNAATDVTGLEARVFARRFAGARLLPDVLGEKSRAAPRSVLWLHRVAQQPGTGSING